VNNQLSATGVDVLNSVQTAEGAGVTLFGAIAAAADPPTCTAADMAGIARCGGSQ
jgi:hypothetical protein